MIETKEIYRFIKEHKNRYTILIGAGLSRESGIKTANKIIEEIKTKIYKDNHSGKKSSPKNIDVWINQQKWFQKTENKYSAVLEKYFPNKGQRKDYFNKLIKGKKPSDGHKYLANIIGAGFVKNILTTNFDKLIERSINQADIDPTVILHEEDPASVSYENNVNILKLHGDYLYENLSNVEDETKKLSKNMRLKLENTLENSGLIIIGYSGNDESIKTILLQLIEKEKYINYGIYWGVRNNSEITANMREIISKASSKGADFFNINAGGKQFFKDLNEYLDIGIPPLINPAIYYGVEITTLSEEINKKMKIQGDLIERPLITAEDVNGCFYKTKGIKEFSEDIIDKKFNGNWIFSSPAGTGKSSLLTYLCLLAQENVFKNKVYIVKNLPLNFDPAYFALFMQRIYSLKIRGRKKILLIFDDLQDNAHFLKLIKFISQNYNNISMFMTIREENINEYSRQINEIENSNIVNLPGYLDTDKEGLKKLIQSKISQIDDKLLTNILSKKLVTFLHIARLYRNIVIEKMNKDEAIEEFDLTLEKSFLSQYLSLNEDEKLCVKLISWCHMIPNNLLYRLLKDLKIPPKRVKKILKNMGLIYDEKEIWVLSKRKYILTIIKIIEQMREVAYKKIIDYDNNNFINLLLKYINSDWLIKREVLMVLIRNEDKLSGSQRSELNNSIQQIDKKILCKHCNKYYHADLIYCPKCGFNLITNEKKVFCDRYCQDREISIELGLCNNPICSIIPLPNKSIIDEKDEFNLEDLHIPDFSGRSFK